MKSSRNIQLTKRYLKENDLVAVPFDKGIGICVMKRQDYHRKLDDILNLPQFEKVVNTRKNAKHPVLKEEERVVDTLKELKNQGKIDKELYKKLKPRGSQPARLYGLAKVHKKIIPTRPVLSMPGSSYYQIGVQVAEWLSKVLACQINSSTEVISDKLKDVQLEDDEELASIDVSSLYTNVPVMEAIDVCTELLYDGNQFTIERQQEGSIPFLDMQFMNNDCRLSSTWYSKLSDTGLIMNFHALAPKRYKRSVVSGFVHRIYRACSSWEHIHSSL